MLMYVSVVRKRSKVSISSAPTGFSYCFNFVSKQQLETKSIDFDKFSVKENVTDGKRTFGPAHVIFCRTINRVKSSKFGHTFANSGNTNETAPYEPSHQDFHCLLS